MSCAQCQGVAELFDDRIARKERKKYLRKGASGTTLRILDFVRGEGVRGRTFLDIGGGIGAIQLELLAAGAASGTSVDASPAYLSVAKEEARARGHEGKIRYLEGDFVESASDIDPADVVSLDRVICCYDDMPTLVDASASRAREMYAISFPREHWVMRTMVGILNLVQRIRRSSFRVFLHGVPDIEARIESHGLLKRFHYRTPLWHVQLYTRSPGDGGPDGTRDKSTGEPTPSPPPTT